MRLNHTLIVPADIETTWAALIDVRGVAECFPGAELDEVDGDAFKGKVRVRLGPISLTYQGAAVFEEKDAGTRRLRMTASGRDAKGNGTAAASVVAQLVANGHSTRVDIRTDLNLTGRPAQFGRGVVAEVSERLVATFADNLRHQLSGASAAGPTGDRRTSGRGAADSVDAWAVVARPLLRRAAPWAALIASGTLLAYRIARRLTRVRGTQKR